MAVDCMSKVWAESSQKGGALLVLLALADYANDDWEAWPKVATLAQKARMTTRNVQSILRALEAAGEVVLIERGGRSEGRKWPNRYRVTPKGEDSSGAADKGEERDTTRVKNATPQGRSGLQGEPSVEPSVEPSGLLRENIASVFGYWKQVFGKDGKTKLTPERRQKISARLGDGYEVDDMRLAIDGCAASDFHVKGGHTDLTLILRNGSKLEQFREMGKTGDDGASEYDRAVRN